MSDQKTVDETPEPTVITLVLPVDKTKPATVTVRNGDLGHLSTFAYDGFKDICTALNEGMRAFVGVQANPPQDIKAAERPKKAKTSKKSLKKKAKKATGKPPYKLTDSKGAVRTLGKMFDPFELQEKYHKENPKFKFDSLDEAVEVAQVLLDAGLEKQITITYSNGKAVKVLPEPKPEGKDDTSTVPEPDDDDNPETPIEPVVAVTSETDDKEQDTTAETEDAETDTSVTATDDSSEDASTTDDDKTSDASDTTDDTPEALSAGNAIQLDTDAKRAMFAVLQDEALTQTIYDAIQEGKKHSWKKNLIKQREVKGIIALHVDGKEALVEAIYEIAFNSSEFENQDEDETPPVAKSAPVITVVTSPELARQEGVPEYNTFSLATDDDDEEDLTPVTGSVGTVPQPTLF